MIDELEQLRRALDAATPPPDRDAKAANLRLAQINFDQRQESAEPSRPTPVSQTIPGRLISGVSVMIDAITSRGGLVATTALVAVGLIVVTPQGRSLFTPPDVVVAPQEPVVFEQPLADAATTLGTAVGSDERESDNRSSALTESADVGVPQAAPAPAFTNEVVGGALTKSDDVRSRLAAPAPAITSEAESGFRNAQQLAPRREQSAQPGRIIQHEQIIHPEADTEAYANAAPNPLKITTEDPVSTFSIDVDTASYSVVRSSLNNGRLPPADAVRVEEMVNYFPYQYPAPDADDAPFRPTVSVMQTPWNADTRLVHIALQGRMPALDDRPPLNLVFLIDTSGSMQDANKLPLLKQSFRLMLGQLRPDDQVAIVTYAGSAGQVLAPTAAEDRSAILAALDRLEAGGSTAGQAGLQQAYAVAEAMAGDGDAADDVTRVVLATDGDFNVGLSDPQALKDFIADKRDSGTYLSVLGFGRGNLDDATMQALAQNGNGQAAYIDTLNEAQKVLVDQLSGALFPIANDVKIQVEFNPAAVTEYRLIGYETRALNREDFNNDLVDAGEIGAGHSVTALYEVTPVGSQAVLSEPLRYQTEATTSGSANELGFLRLRYKEPGAASSQLIETPIFTDMAPVGVEAQFSAAMAGFGQLLRGSNYVAGWSWGNAIALATQSRGEDAFGYRAEAISLMRLAESLSKN